MRRLLRAQPGASSRDRRPAFGSAFGLTRRRREAPPVVVHDLPSVAHMPAPREQLPGTRIRGVRREHRPLPSRCEEIRIASPQEQGRRLALHVLEVVAQPVSGPQVRPRRQRLHPDGAVIECDLQPLSGDEGGRPLEGDHHGQRACCRGRCRTHALPPHGSCEPVLKLKNKYRNRRPAGTSCPRLVNAWTTA